MQKQQIQFQLPKPKTQKNQNLKKNLKPYHRGHTQRKKISNFKTTEKNTKTLKI